MALAVQIKFCIPDMYVSNYKASWMNLCKLFMWMIGHVLLNETQIYCFSFRLSSIVNHLIDIKALSFYNIVDKQLWQCGTLAGPQQAVKALQYTQPWSPNRALATAVVHTAQ